MGVMCLGGVGLRDLTVCTAARVHGMLLANFCELLQDLSVCLATRVCKDVATALQCATPAEATVELLVPPCVPEALASDDGTMIEYSKSTGSDGDGVSASRTAATLLLSVTGPVAVTSSSRSPPCVVITAGPCVSLICRQEFL